MAMVDLHTPSKPRNDCTKHFYHLSQECFELRTYAMQCARRAGLVGLVSVIYSCSAGLVGLPSRSK